MSGEIKIYTIISIIFICLIYYQNIYSKIIYVKSKFNNKFYLVKNDKNKYIKANIICLLEKRINILLKYLLKKYSNKNSRINRLIFRLKNTEILESYFSNSTYSLNKGEKIYLCMVNKNNIINLNTLTYVIIHELAHIMSISYGHNSEFWSNFKFLLKYSIKINIYKYINYENYPMKYCNVVITDNLLNK